jgi:DnaJ-class molecular chaperone
MFGSAFGGSHAPSAAASKDVEVDLPCTILEFYHGAMKYVNYKRQLLALDGHTVREDNGDMMFGHDIVVVKPGMLVGTKLRFKGKGNEQYKKPPTDLVVTLVEAKGEQELAALPEAARQTKRHGQCDLIQTVSVSLQQALKADPISIQTLDGQIHRLPIDQVITPKTVIHLENQGMVKQVEGRDPLEAPLRGDLYVKFDIRFPTKLSEAHRQRLAAILQVKQ